MPEREYQFIDVDQINEDIATGKAKIVDEPPLEVLTGTILDICQLAEQEGMSEEEVDEALRRVADYRAERCRTRFRLHSPEE